MSNTLKFLIIILLLFLVSLIRFLFPLNTIANFNYILNPLIHLVIGLVAIYLLPTKPREREKKNKLKTTLIITAVYLIIFLLFGLLIEFERNPFGVTFSIINLLKNMYVYIPVIFLQEIIRSRLIANSPKKMLSYLLITFGLYLMVFNYSGIRRIDGSEALITFIFRDGVVEFAKQAVLTFMMVKYGISSVLLNRIIIQMFYLITPVFPHMDWFFKGMYDLVAYVMFYLVIDYEAITYDRRARRGLVKKSKPHFYIIILTVLILLICFQLGFFTYAPTAVVTNSMKPVFERGDAVIIKKIKEKDIPNLKIGDIIEYKLGNRYVIHRIIAIEGNPEELEFTTMGDYNNGPDALPVTAEQIVGIAEFSIPFIGYPSVFFIEYFDGSAPDVETGD